MRRSGRVVVDERSPERFCRAAVATSDFELFRVKLATHIPKQSGDGDDGRKGNVRGKDGNEGRNGDAP